MISSRISWPLVCLALIMVGFVGWISDRITLQGERSVYGAECRGGSWRGNTCTGTLAAGERFRFRALKAHNEVIFWIAGSKALPSGKFSACVVEDGGNWRCPAGPDLRHTITREMAHGIPVTDASGQAIPFRRIPKWRWLLLKVGIPAGNDADG